MVKTYIYLLGLQRMSSSSEEIRHLLHVLSKRIDRTDNSYNGQHIAMCLYGLQSMNTDYAEVKELVLILTERIQLSKFRLTFMDIATATYGLQVIQKYIYIIIRVFLQLSDMFMSISN